jgi:hypothetical protein
VPVNPIVPIAIAILPPKPSIKCAIEWWN